MQHFVCSNSGVRVFSLMPADDAAAATAREEWGEGVSNGTTITI